jgi:hypothetical protein
MGTSQMLLLDLFLLDHRQSVFEFFSLPEKSAVGKDCFELELDRPRSDYLREEIHHHGGLAARFAAQINPARPRLSLKRAKKNQSVQKEMISGER